MLLNSVFPHINLLSKVLKSAKENTLPLIYNEACSNAEFFLDVWKFMLKYRWSPSYDSST